jgi:quercetin dioxygenase-like cupin family protein
LVEAEWKPVRAQLGITAFGANGYVAGSVGELVIEDHSEAESGFEELYIVLSGEVTFTLEGSDGVDESFPMTAGEFIYVPPERGRAATSASDDASVLVVGAITGRPFTVSDWERTRLGR